MKWITKMKRIFRLTRGAKIMNDEPICLTCEHFQRFYPDSYCDTCSGYYPPDEFPENCKFYKKEG